MVVTLALIRGRPTVLGFCLIRESHILEEPSALYSRAEYILYVVRTEVKYYFTLYPVPCTVYSVQCTVCSVQYRV
jgi:hypothetical protein